MATSDAETTCEGSLSPKKQKVETTCEGSLSPKQQKVDDDEGENCPICWSLLSERSSTTLGCKHIFHLDCIGSEFNILGCMQCPTCRQVDSSGNWRFWDNKLPANALVRRVPNPNAPLQSGSLRPSRGLVDLLAHDDFNASYDAAVDNGMSTGYEEWMYEYRPMLFSQAWSDMVGGNTPDSESSGHPNLVGVPQSQRRERVVRDASSLDIAPIPGRDPSRTSSSSENPLDRLLFGRGVSRWHQRRFHDVVSTQVQGQYAANFNAATGPALNGRVRQETLGVSTAAEGQQRTRGRRTRAVTYEQERELQAIGQATVEALAARANHGTAQFAGMQDPEIGHEIQAMSVAQHDFDEENPALESRVRHGRREISAPRSRAREREP